MNDEKATTYVAFLRGINVGAHNRMKMAALRRMFAELGFENVTTYIQSGNVIFESTATDTDVLRETIEKEIERTFGYDVTVMIRTRDELQDIVGSNPFAPADGDENSKRYVTFLREAPSEEQTETLLSAQNDAETFAVSGSVVYTQIRTDKHKRGRFIDVGKQLGIPATRRNWQVVTKVFELATSV